MGKRLMSGKDAKSKGKKFSHGSNRGEPGVVKWDEEKHKWIYVGKKQQMTYCKNCGHESHCGNPLRKMIDKSQPHAVGLTEIEVCKMCRCELCEEETKVVYKRYSELCYHDQSDWDWE